jgi:predicted metal-binding membrane protein
VDRLESGEGEDMQFQDASGERIIKRDRLVVVAGLAGVVAFSWACTVYLAWDMQHSENALCGMSQLLMFAMWIIMMAAMMVPSAAPMILIFAAINRNRREQERPFVSTGIFLSGYLVVWSGFSAVITMLQWRLHETALLTPTMASASPLLSGATLLAAGIFQLTPLKHVCLQHCRSPLGFLLANWRDDFRGVFGMGLKHGIYCLGCCWLLMALLFVVGVMNLAWLAVLTVFIALEKIAPAELYLSRVTGLLLMGAGLWMTFAWQQSLAF